MTSIGAAWTDARAARAARVRPPRTPILVRLVTLLAGILPTWSRVRATVLQLAGFGALDFAAYQTNHTFGYAAIGVSLFVLEALSRDGKRERR